MNEVNFATTDIDVIRQRLLDTGCVLLRGFCGPDLIEFRSTIRSIHDEITGPHIFPSHLRERELEQPQHYLFGEKHHALLAAIFGDNPFHDLEGNVSRRVDPSLTGDADWQAPLGPHLDSFFHPTGFTVNFWIPLQTCGIAVPSLGVVQAPFADVIDFTGYDPAASPAPGMAWNFSLFRPGMFELSSNDPESVALFREYWGDRIWTPTYEVGDAMMLSNWTLHFTHVTPAMAGRRENLELRFASNASLSEICTC